MKYIAVETSMKGMDQGEGPQLITNDVGYWCDTPHKAWDIVSGIFSPNHTVIMCLDETIYGSVQELIKDGLQTVHA